MNNNTTNTTSNANTASNRPLSRRAEAYMEAHAWTWWAFAAVYAAVLCWAAV